MQSVKYSQNQISISQLICLTYKTQIGISVITLPGDLIRLTDTDGLIAIIVGYGIALTISLFIIKTMEKHPDKSLVEILPIYLGKGISNLLIGIWMIYSLLIATVILFFSAFIIQSWILSNTPFIFLISLLLVVIYMVVQHGLSVIARMAEFVFLSSIWMPFILLFSLQQVDWYNLFPLVKIGLQL